MIMFLLDVFISTADVDN